MCIQPVQPVYMYSVGHIMSTFCCWRQFVIAGYVTGTCIKRVYMCTVYSHKHSANATVFVGFSNTLVELNILHACKNLLMFDTISIMCTYSYIILDRATWKIYIIYYRSINGRLSRIYRKIQKMTNELLTKSWSKGTW